MVAIDSSVTAISPSEETKMQMFTGKDIFFSLGFHVQYYYKDFGGHVVASIAPTTDLNGGHNIRRWTRRNCAHLGMVMTDDCCYWLTAQSITPGTPAWEQEQRFIVGMAPLTLARQCCHSQLPGAAGELKFVLKILRHWVLNDHNEEAELCALVRARTPLANRHHHTLHLLCVSFQPRLPACASAQLPCRLPPWPVTQTLLSVPQAGGCLHGQDMSPCLQAVQPQLSSTTASQEAARPVKFSNTPSYLLLHHVGYAEDTLSFIKPAALQLMQLKINKLEDPTSLENSSLLSMES
ncbi:hypothetical protein P7K49_036475 [Saguinus oedipus]|uniref:Clu domain-containing protein n=1 Tax=Saguinus oedipus TaxID=9490 RepID=A0ABQ9TK78_SAGOE|nr:hypothetical protein P7K49_036475 [Saguinus oedipus]